MSLLLSSLGSGLIVKFLPLFFIQLHGMSPAEISLLQCANPFMMAAATKLLGSCAQAVGRGKISVFCLVGVILSLIFMSKVSTLLLLLALFIIRGSLANARFPLTWSILMDYTPSTRRGLWNSVLSVLSMSWSASAVLGGAIVDQHSYQYSFQASQTTTVGDGPFFPRQPSGMERNFSLERGAHLYHCLLYTSPSPRDA